MSTRTDDDGGIDARRLIFTAVPADAAARAEQLHELRIQQYRLLRQKEARLLARSFPAFVRAAWTTVEPYRPLEWNWHYDLLCEWLELAAAREQRARRLIINVPPRTLKSTLCTVLWPAWVWTSQPATRWMFISYAKDLSYFHSVARRNLIRSEWYVDRWGTSLAEDQNQKGQYDNQAGGRMFATSVDSEIGGRGADFLVLDDPNNPLATESEADRANAIDKCDTALATRSDDQRSAVRLVIQQRTHQQDVTGHLLEGRTEQWTHVRLPMTAEADERIEYPKTGRRYVRVAGECLFPERFTPEVLAEIIERLGSYKASGQLQQRPSPAEGGMFRRSWWQTFPVEPSIQAEACDEIIQSWDMSFKGAGANGSKGTSRVAGGVLGRIGAKIYMLDVVCGAMDFPATCRAVKALWAKWPTSYAKLVEAKANGPAVIAQLAGEVPGLIPVEVAEDKIARAAAASPTVEAGNVFLPEPKHAPWVSDFIEELANFPTGAHDDQVDMFSQAIARLLESIRGGQFQFGRTRDGDGRRRLADDLRAF